MDLCPVRVEIMSKGFAGLPLQRKVATTLVLVFAAFTVLSYVILEGVIAPAFDELDLEAARTNLIRAERAIQADLENLAAVNADWAPWDDIHDFVGGKNPGFAKSNLNRPTLDNLKLDLMAVYALDSELLWSQLLVEGEGRSILDLGIFGEKDRALPILTAHTRPESRTVGLVDTNLGPLLISSMPILRSDYSGPVAGAMVMGQFLDAARIARLRERTEVELQWFPVDEFARSRGMDDTTSLTGDIATTTSANLIVSFKVVTDIFADPLFVLEADTPRRIMAVGEQTINAGMIFLMATGIFVTVIIGFLLRSTIVQPIGQLSKHIKKIRRSGDLSRKFHFPHDDEIGALAAEFDSLTTEVDQARKALLFQSFKAGKADTAAEVLHNIRNVMTPMINGLERLTKAFKVMDGLRLDQATAALTDPECPDEKKEKFVQYIEASFGHIESVHEDAAEDMKLVTAQARQVEGILADQEKFTREAPLKEDLLVEEVVSEAAHVIPQDTKSEVRLSLDEDLDKYRVRAHRIGLLQVLGNLILNAYESIERENKVLGQISLSASEDTVDDKPMVRLTVRDNGSGFDNGMGQRIFQRGFTSKDEGTTSGLGLHWCANAVRGMGGSIFAESPGNGQGAEFHVLLPTAQGG